ncbi:hypothetical protein PV04_00415 [Phialophora macrospora]|uniref:DUF7587 domain-containing protein n=1 Tax=Phialophora macrospora TaxID=1851006 RepID=A0A0D2FUU2_9EURO|nr:hypothetical protein PV04_00415 [Phialophora macrospora]
MPAQDNPQKHAWTPDDRILLGVMNKFFELSRHDTALIFNAMIRSRLINEGLPRGLSVAAIDAQMNDMKRTTRGQDFQKIQDMPLPRARKELCTQKVEVEATAQALGISLKLRDYTHKTRQSLPQKRPLVVQQDEWSSDTDSSVTTSSNQAALNTPDRQKGLRPQDLPAQSKMVMNKGRRISRARRESTVASTFTSASLSSIESDSCSSGSWVSRSDSEDEVHLDLNANDFGATATRMNPRLRLRFDNQGKSAFERPRLLFRAFDPSHGLRARRFLVPSTRITQPPSYDTDEFGDLARRHLCEDKTFPSPLLSLTQNPARALKIIEKDKQTSRGLAILDYNDLEEKMIQRYGKGNGVWLVPKVCEDHDLDNLTKIHDDCPSKSKQKDEENYTGIGEFLVWAAVETQPIAILNHREALQLQASMESITGISYQSGKVMAPSLDKVRTSYQGVVAYQLLRSFKVDGYLRGSRGVHFEQFIRGIYGEKQLVDPLTSSSLLSDDEEDWVDIPADDTATLRHSKVTSEACQSLTDIKRAKIVVEIPSNTSQSLLLRNSTLYSDSGDLRQSIKPTDTGSQHSNADETTEEIEQLTKPDIANQSSPNPEVDNFTEELLQYAAIPSPTPPPPPPVKEQPKRQRTSALDVSPADALLVKPSPMSAIDLTVEDNHDIKVHSAAAPRRRKMKAPETSLDVVQVIPTTMAKSTTSATSRRCKPSTIQSHFKKVVKSSQQPSKSLAGRVRSHREEENDDDDDEEDDLQIISETIRSGCGPSYLRKTMRTRTTTVLTVRSRSMSESVNVNVTIK